MSSGILFILFEPIWDDMDRKSSCRYLLTPALHTALKQFRIVIDAQNDLDRKTSLRLYGSHCIAQKLPSIEGVRWNDHRGGRDCGGRLHEVDSRKVVGMVRATGLGECLTRELIA
jgi:hypothetical protein